MRQAIVNNMGFVIFIVITAGVSGYWTYRVESFRAKVAKARLAETIASGTKATVVDILDGDEVNVTSEKGDTFVVRILGIKAFNHVANDPGIRSWGERAVSWLKQNVEGKKVTIEFTEFKKDRSGRLLAFLRLGEEDVGNALVADGLALAYTKYPQSREAAYRTAQARAWKTRTGLWGSKEAAARASALKDAWEAARQEAKK